MLLIQENAFAFSDKCYAKLTCNEVNAAQLFRNGKKVDLTRYLTLSRLVPRHGLGILVRRRCLGLKCGLIGFYLVVHERASRSVDDEARPEEYVKDCNSIEGVLK